ncbi:hypothetical protein Tco_0930399, partial [Tanacetum coccineum]
GCLSMASLASSIFIFIVKSLQFEHSAFPGLSAAPEDPEEELAREEEIEGVEGHEKELAFPKVLLARFVFGIPGFLTRHCEPINPRATTFLDSPESAQVKLALEDVDETLNLLNQACLEGIQLDALLFDTILKEASWKV